MLGLYRLDHIYIFNILSLGHILTSYLVVESLCAFTFRYDPTLLDCVFFLIEGVFAWDYAINNDYARCNTWSTWFGTGILLYRVKPAAGQCQSQASTFSFLKLPLPGKLACVIMCVCVQPPRLLITSSVMCMIWTSYNYIV